jgi:hypothetical protein
MSRINVRRNRAANPFWAAVVLSACWASVARAEDAFTLREIHELLVMDLESGTVTEVGAAEIPILAIARSPAGALYAAAITPGVPGLPSRLWTLDPATATPTLVGELIDGLTPLGDLAFDAAGRLWLTAAGQLHEVDLATGMASPVGAPGGSLDGLAALGNELYGIEETAPFRWRLAAVDKVTGGTTPIVPLPALDDRSSFDMDFDSAGRLWILVASFPSVLFRLDDLTSGQLEIVPLGDPDDYLGLAIIPPPTPTEIPVAGTAGLLALAAALLAAGLLRLRRC